jgi:hypothetical protein
MKRSIGNAKLSLEPPKVSLEPPKVHALPAGSAITVFTPDPFLPFGSHLQLVAPKPVLQSVEQKPEQQRHRGQEIQMVEKALGEAWNRCTKQVSVYVGGSSANDRAGIYRDRACTPPMADWHASP